MENKDLVISTGTILLAALVAFLLNHHIISVVLVIVAVLALIGSLVERKTEEATEDNQSERHDVGPSKTVEIDRKYHGPSIIKNNKKKVVTREEYKVKGVTYEDRQEKLSAIYTRCKEDNDRFGYFDEKTREAVSSAYHTFVPEPDNEYDKNAIAIVDPIEGQIGYIPEKKTREIMPEYVSKSYLSVKKGEDFYYATIEVWHEVPKSVFNGKNKWFD